MIKTSLRATSKRIIHISMMWLHFNKVCITVVLTGQSPLQEVNKYL